MLPAFTVLNHHGYHILVIGVPIVLFNSSNHLFVPTIGTVPLTAPETIH